AGVPGLSREAAVVGYGDHSKAWLIEESGVPLHGPSGRGNLGEEPLVLVLTRQRAVQGVEPVDVRGNEATERHGPVALHHLSRKERRPGVCHPAQDADGFGPLPGPEVPEGQARGNTTNRTATR